MVNHLISASDLLKLDITALPMLWDPFYPKTGLVGLAGSSDTGKSTFLRQLCAAVCLNQDMFLGHPLHVKYGKAIYISTEDGKEAVAASLKKQLKEIECDDVQNLKFMFNDGERKQLEMVESALEREPVDLIVVDTWSDAFVGNPNNFSEVRTDLGKWAAIAEKYECLVIILHHTTKNSENNTPDKNRLNGSQAIEAKLRCLLELRNDENRGKILSVLKGNYVPQDFKRNSTILYFDEESLKFETTGMVVERASLGRQPQSRFGNDSAVIHRMDALREEKKSIKKIKGELVSEFGTDRVPSETWMKEHFNKPSGGRDWL